MNDPGNILFNITRSICLISLNVYADSATVYLICASILEVEELEIIIA